MDILSNTTVGEIVKTNFKTAKLFEDSRIDYCCGGTKTISEACSQAGVDTNQLIQKLKSVSSKNDPLAEFFDKMDLSELCDHIIKKHHSYVKNSLGFLDKNLEKLAHVHGGNHPELEKINELFKKASGELAMHMQKEELMLFPYIKSMVQSKSQNTELKRPGIISMAQQIETMFEEHSTEGRRFDMIAKLSDNYKVPDDGCTTYEVTMHELEEFENDLHQHIHLENNILFPKAIDLEKELIDHN